MAGAARSAALKGSAVVGTAVVGFAYYQRLPSRHADHKTAWSEGGATRLYRNFAAPAVMRLDPEMAHNLSLRAAQLWQMFRLLGEPAWTGATSVDWLLRPVPSSSEPAGPSLRQELFNSRLTFDSPVGMAAGYDKNALLVPLYRLKAVYGLGFSEVGSVSALPSAGNPQPRCFRLPHDEAVINRMGLNNEGAEAVAKRLQEFAPLERLLGHAPVGINIAKTHSPSIYGEAAIEDFVASFKALAPHADFIVINISCPNTAEGKTFEEPDTLQSLLEAISRVRPQCPSPPVLVKLSAPIAPDEPAGEARLRSLVDIAQASGIVDGFVISNTAGDREVPLSKEGKEISASVGRGGISGRPLHARSTATISQVYKLTGGRVPIIGVGGVDSAETAYSKIRAGASLIEVYTGIVYNGPGLFEDIHVGLRRLLERDGFSSISEAVGADARLS